MNINITSANIRTWSRIGSGGTFGQTLLELAKNNDKVVAISADMTTASGLERFKTAMPERFFNAGIAEQNLIGIAAGLAKEGFIPFAATQAAFISLRCSDQIKVNMGYMKLSVKLIGILSGFGIGIFGPTHMALEDVALIRAIPNIVILSPADCLETTKAVNAASELNEPVYIRLSGGVPNPVVYKDDYDYQIGKAITLKEGDDVAIIATGSMVYNSLKVAEILAEGGYSARVVDMHTIKPLDTEAIMMSCSAKLIVTVEEHSIHGGLGSAIAERLAPLKVKPPQLIVGVNDFYPHAGEYNWLLEQSGLTVPQIAEKILSSLKN
ncbi:MAG: transketolase [Clostridiales bacterium]|jgi:transketolase|nr:transketolase [Clostridiales bacterium]